MTSYCIHFTFDLFDIQRGWRTSKSEDMFIANYFPALHINLHIFSRNTVDLNRSVIHAMFSSQSDVSRMYRCVVGQVLSDVSKDRSAPGTSSDIPQDFKTLFHDSAVNKSGIGWKNGFDPSQHQDFSYENIRVDYRLQAASYPKCDWRVRRSEREDDNLITCNTEMGHNSNVRCPDIRLNRP